MWTTIRTVLDSFIKALDFQTYRLRRKTQHYDGHVASNVEKFVKRLRSQRKKAAFDESDPIPLLAFSKDFRNASDNIGVQDGVAICRFPHFMEMPAS